jgi:pyruvate carboxylase subunit B
MKRHIEFMVTAFRDGLQSSYGARVLSRDYLPVVEAAANAGIRHFESGGGALFQTAFFYSNENAFDVMDAFRLAAGSEANLQTLSRGINVVGLDSQPSDIIRLHAQLFKKHATTTIRNFDALNDLDNLSFSGRCISEAGLKHELAISMMEMPPGNETIHSAEFYIGLLRRIMESGISFDSLCFKDASGTSHPRKVFETISGARKLLGKTTKLVFHTHDTAGTGTLAYMSALEAGVDQIDLSLAPCSGGTCQPDIITLWHALRGTDFDLDVDIQKVIKLEEVFKHAMRDYPLLPEAGRVEPLIPFFPLPGGALSANTQMLRDNGLMDKYPEIIAAMGEAVVKGGFGTSVTPVSQFYFQQAYNNVMLGPWKEIAEGYGKMVLGYFGKTPMEPDPAIVQLASNQLGLAPTTESPRVINDRDHAKGAEAARAILAREGLPETEENIFIVATCREKGVLFLKGLATAKPAKSPRPSSGAKPTARTSQAMTVTINNRAYGVEFHSPGSVSVNGITYSLNLKEGLDSEAIARTVTLPKSDEAAGVAEIRSIDSPLSGFVSKLNKKSGDKVAIGETILIVETMGMSVPVNANLSGVIVEILTSKGEPIEQGQGIARISTISHGSKKTVSHARDSTTREVGEKTALVSPSAGIVLKIYKSPGEMVRIGESILVLEAMKMETPISSTRDGLVDRILVRLGDQVKEGQNLVLLSPGEEA